MVIDAGRQVVGTLQMRVHRPELLNLQERTKTNQRGTDDAVQYATYSTDVSRLLESVTLQASLDGLFAPPSFASDSSERRHLFDRILVRSYIACSRDGSSTLRRLLIQVPGEEKDTQNVADQ
jgi:hypothetical protein